MQKMDVPWSEVDMKATYLFPTLPLQPKANVFYFFIIPKTMLYMQEYFGGFFWYKQALNSVKHISHDNNVEATKWDKICSKNTQIPNVIFLY